MCIVLLYLTGRGVAAERPLSGMQSYVFFQKSSNLLWILSFRQQNVCHNNIELGYRALSSRIPRSFRTRMNVCATQFDIPHSTFHIILYLCTTIYYYTS